MPSDIDTLIDESHAAAQAAEDEALQVLGRIRRVPGLSQWGKSNRSCGDIVNPWAPRSANLSAQGMILKHDPALAAFLAAKAGVALPSREAQAEAEAKRRASIESLEAQTAKLRERNQAVRAQRQRELMHGRWNNIEGRWV